MYFALHIVEEACSFHPSGLRHQGAVLSNEPIYSLRISTDAQSALPFTFVANSVGARLAKVNLDQSLGDNAQYKTARKDDIIQANAFCAFSNDAWPELSK